MKIIAAGIFAGVMTVLVGHGPSVWVVTFVAAFAVGLGMSEPGVMFRRR